MRYCVKCKEKRFCRGIQCENDGYINKPDAHNCWHIYKYMIEGKEHTLEEIGEILGISHTKSKQVLEEALEKVKVSLPKPFTED